MVFFVFLQHKRSLNDWFLKSCDVDDDGDDDGDDDDDDGMSAPITIK